LTSEVPFFSVILSTFGRGRHIGPTIASVLAQSYGRFELIVVGDGCRDETESAVRSFPPERITWLNLAQNTGSQSFPNNAGLTAARGNWIAYIGHDDIWVPDHLACIVATIAREPASDFVVSGCVYHGPQGSEACWVTGLFDDPAAPFEHFFPPTSLAHPRDVIARIGEWRDPRTIRPPVDSEFLLRAAGAGLRFASTLRITAHKFAAGHRYLSYLRMSSDEQDAMLRALKKRSNTEDLIATARRNGGYMTMRHPDYARYPAGHLFEQNRQNKGLSRPALRPLRGRVVMAQTDELRALDWYGVEVQGNKKYRWSGPNPRPRILIPYTGDKARVAIEVLVKPPDTNLAEVLFAVEGQPLKCRVETEANGIARLAADIPLARRDYTVLTVHAPMFRPSAAGLGTDSRRLGIAVADIVLEPL
jgi:glycosyltransferase involved in cell wall biosynthesis